MRFLTRSLAGLFITALTFGLLFLAGFQLFSAVQARREGPGPARPVAEQVFTARLATLTPATIDPVMQVFGTVRSRRELQLRAGASGRLTFLDPAMQEGGQVRAGQVLARIDPAAAQAALDTAQAARDEAEARLADARRSVDLAGDDLTAAEGQAALRRDALTRQQRLADRGLGTSVEREAAELATSGAEQAVLSRRSALANAESAVTSAGIALRRAEITLSEARRALDDTQVIAGFDGRVTAVTAVEGALVTMNEQLAKVIDPAALEVEIPLSLDQFARLLAGGRALDGTRVTVVLDGSAGRITAPAVLDRAAASVAAGTAGRTVYARLEARDARLRPGDFVTVEIDEPPVDSAAVIPSAAVGADGAVLVLGEGDRLTARPVEVLRRQGDSLVIAVPADLAGARIVAERAPQLGSGIRVRDADAPAPQDQPRKDGGKGKDGGERGGKSTGRDAPAGGHNG